MSKIIYLLKYNAGDLKGAQNLLLDNLNRIIIDNNTYFQLLSDYLSYLGWCPVFCL